MPVTPRLLLHPLWLLPVLLPLIGSPGYAHTMPDGTVMSDDEMTDGDMAGMDMEDDAILGQPLGSGTSWLPEGSPVHSHALHFGAGDWMFMTHGEINARYTGQNLNNTDRNPPPSSATGSGSLHPELERGGARFDAPNWAMLSAQRTLFDSDVLLLRAMLSLDPATEGREGYPLLFQTGEGLVDRQHAHDLFMELALLYAHPINEDQRVFVYAGLPGEPASGPTAFMHRPSAGANPEAPLAHHFQDATHITAGVLTGGYIYKRSKIEVSTFRGREPDANRWNLDVGPLDSYSLRLTQNVGDYSLQASIAHVNEPEADEHGDVVRTTASITRNTPVRRGTWSSTFVYGSNAGHHGKVLHSFLKESSLEMKRAALWTRFEVLQRLGSELDLPTPRAESEYWVEAFTLGAGATLFQAAGLDFFLAGQGAVNFGSPALDRYYGGTPLSAQVFLKVRPHGL
jgi:hypothetical protein